MERDTGEKYILAGDNINVGDNRGLLPGKYYPLIKYQCGITVGYDFCGSFGD